MITDRASNAQARPRGSPGVDTHHDKGVTSGSLRCACASGAGQAGSGLAIWRSRIGPMGGSEGWAGVGWPVKLHGSWSEVMPDGYYTISDMD